MKEDNNIKKCPYCAEEIQDEAIVCRYCGRDLVAKPIPIYPATPADSVEIKKAKKKTSAGKIILFVILCILVVCIGLVLIGNALNKTTKSGLIAPPTSAVLIPADYGTIAAGELQTYADQHKGEKVKVALDIVSFTPGGNNRELQGFISGTGTEIIVELVNPASGIYVNDTVTIYGTITGNFSYTSVAGWKMTEPQLIDAFYTKP